MRVHELAKELDISSKDLLEVLHDLKIEAKSHMSALLDDQVAAARESFNGSSSDTPAPEAAEDNVTPPTEPSAIDAPQANADTEAEKEPVETKDPEKEQPKKQKTPKEDKVVIVKGPIIVKEYAEKLGVKPNQLIAELMTMNVFASINERIDLKMAQKLAEKHGLEFKHEKKTPEHKPAPPKPVEEKPAASQSDKPEDIQTRPPVVTFLGHVDHGKTSLLDKIRNAHVVKSEDGGITQHIGAYTVNFQDHPITFLDTPGHEAFTSMRARGANLTDVAVLIIAADDGIMPQTREAIQHAKAAGVCIMVAINKSDLRAANVDRVKQQLQQADLTPEDWGGEIICIPVSAMTGDGIDHLLEMILLQSEMLELKANPKRKAEGYVIEAKMEPGMGPTATVLVKNGTLHVGDAMVCGPYWGRIKALINDQGVKVRTAGPSAAVKCLGLTDVPEPGSEFLVYSNDRAAKTVSEERLTQKRLESISQQPKRASLDDLFSETGPQETQELNVILKTDVQGSLEAIQQSLLNIESDKVTIKILLAGVGNITGNDVLLATASNAIILGFHVGKEDGVSKMAKREGVEIRLYSVIYELLDNVREAMTGLLEPVFKEKTLGKAEIRQVFEISKTGRIAGCMVIGGRVYAKSKARVVRNNDIIYDGTIASLKRFQNDANEVRDGQECGIRMDNFNDIQPGDIIEFYDMEKIAQQL